MLFTSYAFIGFCLCLLILYYALPRSWQRWLLLLASGIFAYASGPENLAYLTGIALITWLGGRAIDKSRADAKAFLAANKDSLSKDERKALRTRQKAKIIHRIASAVVLNLGILALVKTLQLSQNLPSRFAKIIFPIGISFYTFKAVGYLIDVYREIIPADQNFGNIALFLSFFPELVQGPISRYGDLAPALCSREGHPFCGRQVAFGLQRVLWGYFKKMVLADRLLPVVTKLTGADAQTAGLAAIIGALLYTAELYADFTGGIDITIGLAEAMGIPVKENFIRPYFSKSLKEYWRRWHITMCEWFRDYLFYPLSTCKPMQKLSKFSRSKLGDLVGKRIPVYLASLIVWFSTGLWHGANSSFILWGILNWAVLMISEEFEPLYRRFRERFPRLVSGTGYKIFSVGRTFLLLTFLNLFDLFRTPAQVFRFLGSAFLSPPNPLSLASIGLAIPDLAVLALGFALCLAISLIQRKGSVRGRISQLSYPLRFLIWFGLFLAVLIFGAYGRGYDAGQFIYNRF